MVAAGNIADIVAFNHGEPVLVVEVKSSNSDRYSAIRQLEEYAKLVPAAQFLMLVDADEIRIYDADKMGWDQSVARLRANDIFAAYDPEFGERPVLGAYLESLTAAWLKDLSHGWRGEPVPGAPHLAGIGLRDRLVGASILSNVALPT